MTPVYPAGIRFTIDTIFDDDALEASFIGIKGDIFCYRGEEDETEVRAGELEAYIVDVYGAEALGYSVADIFDQMQESFECYELLFDHGSGEMKESFVSDFDDAPSRNIVLLNRLQVLPDFRGARIGLAAISRTLDVFGAGCGYAVLNAAPLQSGDVDRSSRAQWYQAMRLSEFSGDIDLACLKLQKHYALLGFRPIADTTWMALNLSYTRPRLADIGWT